jgi:hypothetical protein
LAVFAQINGTASGIPDAMTAAKLLAQKIAASM